MKSNTYYVTHNNYLKLENKEYKRLRYKETISKFGHEIKFNNENKRVNKIR